MHKFTVLIIAILLLSSPLISPCSAQVAIFQGGAAGNAGHAPSSSLEENTVTNIVVSKIEEGVIYAKDGRQFFITGVKVINNSRPEAGVKGAELGYKNGILEKVILK